MKFTSSSTARFRTRFASSTSLGSPQIPFPVSRIAPNPRRFTSRSPPILNVFAGVLMLQRSTAESAPQSCKRRFLDDPSGLLVLNCAWGGDLEKFYGRPKKCLFTSPPRRTFHPNTIHNAWHRDFYRS